MSKKSRKRNKKILAMLALAGGAAMMGRGKGTAQGVSGSDKAKFTSDAAYSPAPTAVTGTEYPGANKAVSRTGNTGSNYLGRMKGGNPDDPTGEIGQKIRANYAQKGRYVNPNEQTLAAGNAYVPRIPRVHVGRGRKDGGRIEAKHGGRVTGIAKRGFGRALGRGKK